MPNAFRLAYFKVWNIRSAAVKRESLVSRVVNTVENKSFTTSVETSVEPKLRHPIRYYQRPDHLRNKMRSSIQFITTPTADTPGTALLLHFDDKRYIIGNIHEGLQRAGLQVGARFYKAKDILITGKTDWHSHGGLFGLILTLADATQASAASRADNAKVKLERRRAREEEELLNSTKRTKNGRSESTASPRQTHVHEEDPTVTLHGGQNLTHTVATARSFIFRRGTPLKVVEHHPEKIADSERNWEPTWEDERVQVWAMAITPVVNDKNPHPASPRKRSLGEYMDGQSQASIEIDEKSPVQIKTPEARGENGQQIRDLAVSEMFSSTWHHDNLVETPLDEVVLPAALFVRDPHSKQLHRYSGPLPDGTTPVPNIKVLVRKPWPGALIDHLPPTKPSEIAMSYIIRNQQQRGKFKPDVAKSLNVPLGPLWAELARGFEVESLDGKIVSPGMVLMPSKGGTGFAVVDLPSKDYVRDLIERPEWDAQKVMTGIEAIIWILGPGVSSDQKLRQFIDDKKHLKHIISSSDHCPNRLVQTSAATAAIRHHQIDPLRFPIPLHSNVAMCPLDQPAQGLLDVADRPLQPGLLAKPGLKVDLAPNFGITENLVVPYLNTALVAQTTPRGVLEYAQSARNKIKHGVAEATSDQALPCSDAEIICLGTGSALPSPYRNVSGTLLRVPGYGSYLLDCGENTLGQLKRIFTETELAEIFHDLKLIWISHLHADHHLGISSVIKAWYREVHGVDYAKRRSTSSIEQHLDPAKFLKQGKRLFVVAHEYMTRWLKEYSSVEDFGYHQIIPVVSLPVQRNFPDRCNLVWNGFDIGFNTATDPEVKSAMREATSLSNLVAVPVSHCFGAQAVSLTFPNGFKFSYSGDCRPSREFARVGQGSTVLLHEATFDDQLRGDAMAKKHCTTSEAIGVGVAMGAKRVLLTHFSQRYQNLPSLDSMKRLNVRFEEVQETDNAMEGMEPPVDAEIEPNVEVQTDKVNPSEVSHQLPDRNDTEVNTLPLSHSIQDIDASVSKFSTSINTAGTPKDRMRIGVAFDYMRVKVGDIIHLDKFTPALRELYKEGEEEKEHEMGKPAEEASSNDQVITKPAKSGTRSIIKNGQEMLQAEGESKRQEKKTEKRQRNQSYWQSQEAEGKHKDGESPPRPLEVASDQTSAPVAIAQEHIPPLQVDKPATSSP